MKFYLICIILFFNFSSYAEEKHSFDDDMSRVKTAMSLFLSKAPGRKISKDKSVQEEISHAIVSASRDNGLPPLLLLSMATFESSLRLNALGKLGEVGILQVHGKAANGCELKTYYGQATCGAKWLRICIDMCGNISNGIAMYGSGECDIINGSSRESMVNRRIRRWKRYEKDTKI